MSVEALRAVTVVRLIGSFGTATCASWTDAVHRVVTTRAGAVIVDLADVTLADDTAVAALDRLNHELAERGRKLVLVNVYDDVRDQLLDQHAGHLVTS